jgi:hypothetical protein
VTPGEPAEAAEAAEAAAAAAAEMETAEDRALSRKDRVHP